MDIEQIKIVLKERRMTYSDLSKLSNVPESTLKNLFAGYTRNPRIDTMQAIEQALNIQKEQKETPPALTDGERELLNKFSQIPAEQRTLFFDMLEVFLKNQK
jgi:predicted transcriptional regulator